MRATIFSLAIAAILAGAAVNSVAQPYPARPIRLLIPFPPGGGADISGRLIARALSERWNVQIVVDNRPGASNIVATEIVARSNPDGYTLLMATATHAINPSMFAKRPYDEYQDFVPLVIVSNSPNLIAVNLNTPIRNLGEFVGYAGFDVNYWLGLIGPAKLPPAVVAKINKDANAALASTEVRDQFLAQGAEPAGGTPQEFDALIKREIQEWIAMVKKAGIQTQ